MEPDADFSAKTIIRSLAASLVEPYKIPQVVRRVDAIAGHSMASLTDLAIRMLRYFL
jgi:hypothetical protein